MAIMLGALYRALIEGNASEDTARKAAEEVAAYESRLSAMEARLTLLSWMMGTLLVMVTGLFWQGFAILQRLPR
jgi:hypothetical protein